MQLPQSQTAFTGASGEQGTAVVGHPDANPFVDMRAREDEGFERCPLQRAESLGEGIGQVGMNGSANDAEVF